MYPEYIEKEKMFLGDKFGSYDRKLQDAMEAQSEETQKPFKGVNHALSFYFQTKYEKAGPGSMSLDRPFVDGGKKGQTPTWLDLFASIGYYMAGLNQLQYKCLKLAFVDNLDDYGIAKIVSRRPEKVKSIIDGAKKQVEGDLRGARLI